MLQLLTVLPLIQSAIGVLGAFQGNAAQARATGYVQDAVNVITSLTPLIEQFGSGKEVTEDDVRAALAGKDKALSDFDALIALKGRP